MKENQKIEGVLNIDENLDNSEMNESVIPEEMPEDRPNVPIIPIEDLKKSKIIPSIQDLKTDGHILGDPYVTDVDEKTESNVEGIVDKGAVSMEVNEPEEMQEEILDEPRDIPNVQILEEKEEDMVEEEIEHSGSECNKVAESESFLDMWLGIGALMMFTLAIVFFYRAYCFASPFASVIIAEYLISCLRVISFNILGGSCLISGTILAMHAIKYHKGY